MEVKVGNCYRTKSIDTLFNSERTIFTCTETDGRMWCILEEESGEYTHRISITQLLNEFESINFDVGL